MEMAKLLDILQSIDAMDAEIGCIDSMLEHDIVGFTEEVPELHLFVCVLWSLVASRCILHRLRENIVAEINQQRLGG